MTGSLFEAHLQCAFARQINLQAYPMFRKHMLKLKVTTLWGTLIIDINQKLGSGCQVV